MPAKTDIWVYAHWIGMGEPRCIGILSAQQAKGRKAFSFAYDKDWMASKEQRLLDPDISWFPGTQYPQSKENFGMFLDSMPDTWGRKLMMRRAKKNLYDIDFLLGVYDESRMGALRFKLDPQGEFLDNDRNHPTPHWTHIRELQLGAMALDADEEDADKWIDLLIAPGSSLGGARPKANILDAAGHLWIAKFPAKADIIDKAAWEYLAYKLAVTAGIEMSESKIEKISGNHHTFFTKRFDRKIKERIHFASAMTMTGNDENKIRDNPASYLDLAEFIQYSGADNETDLHQLWRRLIFNIAISNTDDHLRNHGFILAENGWHLSPAYDINPSVNKGGLALNIDTTHNDLSFDLARSVGEYFQLNNRQMDTIIDEVRKAGKNWQTIATQVGISRPEQEIMAPAFAEKH
jgi:serine/threonine-protein kinase HipA